jgi:phosphoglycolate phosphatase
MAASGHGRVMSAPPGLVVFDFDGTLADTFAVFRDVFDEVIDRFALRRPDADDVHRLRAQTSVEILRWLGVPPLQLPAIMRHARLRMAERAHELSLFPGMEAVVRGVAAQGVHVAVVSSNAERTVRTVLRESLCGEVHAFRCGVSVFGKAARVRGLMRRARVSPGQTVLVGDEERDIAAARAVGARAVAVTWGYAAADALRDADVLCVDVRHLAATLGLDDPG